MLDRHGINNALRQRLEPLDYVTCMFEAGSASFGRLDELSDIDLVIEAQRENVGEVWAVIEQTLASLSPLDLRWEVPQPAWHGMEQRFYHLADSPRYLYIDICIRNAGEPATLNEREQHGEPIVVFDKAGTAASSSLDWDAHNLRMRARLQSLRDSLPMMFDLARKEVLRGNPVDAAGFYHGNALRPLVELLRMKHCPERYTFGFRYVKHDLPADAVKRLEKLLYPNDVNELGRMVDEAQAWAEELLGEL